MRSPLLVRALLVLGGIMAALGLVAGHFNREVLDGPTFADNVDEIRRDDAVVEILGSSIAKRFILANPDFVAVRPLVSALAINIAGGDLLSRPVRLAAQGAHGALTKGDGRSVVVRIANVGALVAAGSP